MSNFREKIPTFIFGLLFGLLIAGSFFVLKLDTYFKELNFYKKIAESIPSFNNEESDESKTFSVIKNAKNVEDGNEVSTKKENTETGKKSTAQEVIESGLTISNSFSDSIQLQGNSTQDEIRIKKDELINAKTFTLIQLNRAEKITSKDSVLTKLSGIYSDNTVKMMSVEFWQSPLNFRGYKMSKYKIVLFGVKWSGASKLFKLNNSVFFKNGNVVYEFDYTSEFTPYKEVRDESVIAKLK